MSPDIPTTPQELEDQARRAKALLENPILQQAFSEAEEGFTRAWKRAETPERREFEHAKVQALEEVRRVLRTYINRAQVSLRRS